MTPAIELIDVHAGYGRIEVLHGVSFAVPTGCVFALLGPNGGGKSTTLQVISGKIRPTSGCMHIAGTHLNGARPEALARAGVSRIPEGRGIFPNLTVEENLRMWTYAAGLSARDVQERAFTRFPRLKERRGQRAGTMSGGEQQMLALARALMLDPRILLIDEPSVGLAPVLVSRTIDKIKELKDSYQLTVLMAEQNFPQALRIADRGYVIVHGKIAFEGRSADELNNNDLIRKFYLGL